jgi:hypothetical protein
MLKFVIGVLGALAIAHPVPAQVQPFPASFRTQEIETNSVTIHVRVGGNGPAVVLLHGYGETGDMWAPLAAVWRGKSDPAMLVILVRPIAHDEVGAQRFGRTGTTVDHSTRKVLPGSVLGDENYG